MLVSNWSNTESFHPYWQKGFCVQGRIIESYGCIVIAHYKVTTSVMYTNLLFDYSALSCDSYALSLRHLEDFTFSLVQNSSTVDADSVAEGFANLCGELLSCGDERGRQFAYNSVTEVCRRGSLLL